MLDTTKFIKELESRMEENDKYIEEDMDADDACSHENDALDMVISMIKSGSYDLEQSIHFITEDK